MVERIIKEWHRWPGVKVQLVERRFEDDDGLEVVQHIVRLLYFGKLIDEAIIENWDREWHEKKLFNRGESRGARRKRFARIAREHGIPKQLLSAIYGNVSKPEIIALWKEFKKFAGWE